MHARPAPVYGRPATVLGRITVSDMSDALYVAVASYDSADTAESHFEALKAAFEGQDASHDFDAAVIAKRPGGKVDVVTRYEAPVHHGAGKGLKWGLAVGAVTALFPAVGIFAGLAAGGSGGAVLGALSGHIQRGVSRDDLKEMGEVLDEGEAGLVVVYTDALADEVTRNLQGASRWLAKPANIEREELASDLKETAASPS
jgi:uncharacterized membrane protein